MLPGGRHPRGWTNCRSCHLKRKRAGKIFCYIPPQISAVTKHTRVSFPNRIGPKKKRIRVPNCQSISNDKIVVIEFEGGDATKLSIIIVSFLIVYLLYDSYERWDDHQNFVLSIFGVGDNT